MSLLDDVSIVVTPNGYKAGTLYGVIPVPTEGSNVVVNGDFETDSNWIKGSGWSIASGKATGSSTTSNLQQLGILQSGKTYKLTFTISNFVSGSLRPNIGTVNGTLQSSNGTFTEYITSLGSHFYFDGVSAFTGSIDNVSIKEWVGADMDVTRATAATRVDENGLVNYAEVIGSELVTNGDFATDSDWTIEDVWTISGGSANGNGANGSSQQLVQSIVFEIGKTYKVTYDIINYVSGSVFMPNVGSSNSGNGTYIEYITATQQDFKITGTNFYGSVTNISVKEVTRDNVPRIDYTGGGCPHILAEPQRTNEVTYSEDFTDSSWVKTNVDVSNNTELAPNGTETATRAIISSTGTDLRTQCNVIESTNYTFTFYAKKGTSTDITYRVYDVSNGSNIVSPTNYFSQVGIDWQRVELNFTTPSGCTSVLVYLSSDSAVVGDIYLWGVQLEKSYATSYIPTSGSTVTRNQDIFTRDGIGSLINSEGVLFAEMAAFSNDGTNRKIALSDGTGSNLVRFYFSNSSNRVVAQVKVGGSTQVTFDITGITVTNFNKVALKYKENDFAIWINGVERGTDTSGTTPSSMNKIAFDNGAGSDYFYGKVKQLQVYTTALTDAQLTSLTT